MQSYYSKVSVSPNSSSFHESKTALHEKYDDGHDEQEKVVDVFGLFGMATVTAVAV